mmetsp:Transcript_39761/g.81779  ORF Transcript_39761/g.81779 Transcript_39761/m.81779 type:complete len:447 (-) Transcript_39761:5989-7329(-)
MRPTSSSTSAAALALISAAAVASSSSSEHFASAFVPTSPSQNSAFFSRASTTSQSQSKSQSDPTKLCFGMNDNVADDSFSIGSNKKKGNKGAINPENIQSYITEPSESRIRPASELGDTVLVSGFVNPASPTLGRDSDQTIFDLLNDPSHDSSGLDFDRIVAFVPDSSFAKKRLVSRTSRYSGLLNKLSFLEADGTTTTSSSDGSLLPSSEQLEGVTTWVARVEESSSADPIRTNLDAIETIVRNAKASSSVRNVALLLCDVSTLNMEAALDAVKTLSDDEGKDITYTVVAVGKTDGDVPEATLPYSVCDLFAASPPEAQEEATTTTTPAPGDTGLPYAASSSSSSSIAASTYSREESLRLLTTCLGLDCGRNRALAFTAVDNVNATTYKLVKGLREAGYTWSQELEHMVEDGVEVRFCSYLCRGLPVYNVSLFNSVMVLAVLECI